MKFGKTTDIDQINFALPPDHAQTARVLGGLAAPLQPKLYFGCPAWGCKDWVGKIYPPKTKSADFLKYYAHQFTTIELNTTHYRIPDKDTVLRWRGSVPKQFRFCPKVPQSISHRASLLDAKALVQQFADAVALLEDNLGPCFMQLPPYFAASKAGELMQLLEQWPSEIPLSVELRHESWFEEGAPDGVWEKMEQLGMASVITDVAGRRDVLHQRLTSPTAVIRFVGNELHPTDYSRLDEWIGRWKQWVGQGLPEIYVFLHEPEEVLCPELASHLIIEANKHLPVSLKPLARYDAERQGSLF